MSDPYAVPSSFLSWLARRASYSAKDGDERDASKHSKYWPWSRGIGYSVGKRTPPDIRLLGLIQRVIPLLILYAEEGPGRNAVIEVLHSTDVDRTYPDLLHPSVEESELCCTG